MVFIYVICYLRLVNKSAHPLRSYLLASVLLVSSVGMNPVSAQLLPISGVTATSNAANEEGNPGFTVSNNSLVAGASAVLGASDSLGDAGFNSYTPPSTPNYTSGTNGNGSDFGNFVTNLEGTNLLVSPTPVITYNLGAVYNVSDLLVWNFSQSGFTNVGANSITILSSTTGLPFSFTAVGTFTLTEAAPENYNSPRAVPGGIANIGPAPAAEPAQDLNFSDLSISNPDAQYIELVINSNYGFTETVGAGYGPLVGINEVNFVGTAIPEPSTYAMMLGGLALLGFCVRRKLA